MKWKKYTIETTTAAEDFMSSMLMELGIEGIEIEDNIPLTKEDQADMFIDFALRYLILYKLRLTIRKGVYLKSCWQTKYS